MKRLLTRTGVTIGLCLYGILGVSLAWASENSDDRLSPDEESAVKRLVPQLLEWSSRWEDPSIDCENNHVNWVNRWKKSRETGTPVVVAISHQQVAVVMPDLRQIAVFDRQNRKLVGPGRLEHLCDSDIQQHFKKKLELEKRSEEHANKILTRVTDSQLDAFFQSLNSTRQESSKWEYQVLELGLKPKVARPPSGDMSIVRAALAKDIDKYCEPGDRLEALIPEFNPDDPAVYAWVTGTKSDSCLNKVLLSNSAGNFAASSLKCVSADNSFVASTRWKIARVPHKRLSFACNKR